MMEDKKEVLSQMCTYDFKISNLHLEVEKQREEYGITAKKIDRSMNNMIEKLFNRMST